MGTKELHNGGKETSGRRVFSLLKAASFGLVISLMSSLAGPPLLCADDTAIQEQFHPYSKGEPHIPGLQPGVTLDATNASLAKEVLPDEVLPLLTAGDFTIYIQATSDLPLRQSYIDATVQYSQGVALNSGGTLQNYHSGLPFPLLDTADPQAGEKLAWNFRYRDLGDTFEMWPTTREVNASGAIEHFDRGIMRIRFGMHRPNPTDNDPQWEERGIWQKSSFEILSPSDREGIFRVLTVFDNDERPSEQWRYSPQTRRTRKDHVNYLAPIGGTYEVLQEESPPSFFHGYLHPYRWTFLGARVMLVPGFAKSADLKFGGKGEWYPQIPWELRRVLLLESMPKETHPFGRRVYFIDQQTYAPLLILTYTSEGAFLRLLITAHVDPRFHPRSNSISLPRLNGGTAINYTKQRATLFTAESSTIYNTPLPAERFGLIEILRRGK